MYVQQSVAVVLLRVRRIKLNNVILGVVLRDVCTRYTWIYDVVSLYVCAVGAYYMTTYTLPHAALAATTAPTGKSCRRYTTRHGECSDCSLSEANIYTHMYLLLQSTTDAAAVVSSYALRERLIGRQCKTTRDRSYAAR